MTIHNLKFQGRWNLEKIKDALAIDDYYFTEDKLEYYKDANLLKGGLVSLITMLIYKKISPIIKEGTKRQGK